MGKPHEVRAAVGTSAGRRSTVWKFAVHKNEVYILSRMFGADTKVSLHSSGDCQWSGTGAWVTKILGRTNAKRHFVKWKVRRPTGTEALHVFQIRIPETELRVVERKEGNLDSVEWLPTPPIGHTVSLECYITPVMSNSPALSLNLPCHHLYSLPLADGRWFTVLYHVPALDGKDFEPLRDQMNGIAQAAGIKPNPQHRGVAFTVSDGTARGFIELCSEAVDSQSPWSPESTRNPGRKL